LTVEKERAMIDVIHPAGEKGEGGMGGSLLWFAGKGKQETITTISKFREGRGKESCNGEA